MKHSNTRWVAGQHEALGVFALLVCGLLLATLPGCRRKAPGPDECVAFAKFWVERRHLERGLAAADPFDDLVRDCLTIPYDRALVECVLDGKAAPDRCRSEYVRRVEERREANAR